MTRPLVTVAILTLVLSQIAPAPVSGQVIVVGNDEKVIVDDRGQPVFLEPGKDNVTFLDMSSRQMPAVIGTLLRPNSLIGPPTNVAVTPDQRLALISNALSWVRDGDRWKPEPDNKLHIVDLRARPPRHVGSSVVVLKLDGKKVTRLAEVEVGGLPEGVVFSPDGGYLYVGNYLDRVPERTSAEAARKLCRATASAPVR